MDIIIKEDGLVTPFNIQSSRETRFTVAPQTVDATEERQSADGDIDFGTWVGMGEFNLHGIIEFDTQDDKKALLDNLWDKLNQCRSPQKIYYEHSPERHRFVRITGRPDVVAFAHHIEVRIQFKCDPYWHTNNASIAGSGITIVPEYIEIKDATGKRVAFLSPESDGLKDVYPDCRLNGESKLEFKLPANSPKIGYLAAECQIHAGSKVYSLLDDNNIDYIRDEKNTLWAQYIAKERWHDLNAQFPEPYITNDPSTPTPSDLAVIIVSGGSDLSDGRYTVGTAAHALYAVLNDSGWTIGTVDVEGIHDLEMEKVSRLELVKAIQNTWGGYLVWDSVNKTVSLRDGGAWQNYTGFQIQYKLNLKHITRTQSNRLITKMYAFGHDDLDIASVNDGVKYLTNNSYTAREYTGVYKNQDIYDAEELKEKAAAELALNCRPRYLYNVKMVDLRTLPEYSHEDFTVGDMADVIDPNIAPDSPRPRIIRHKYNLFQPWECEIELGDPQERIIEQLKASFENTAFVGGKFNGSGRSSGYSVENGSIGADKLKVNELVVGDNISMGENAYISWSQVTDANAYSVSAWKASGYATHINSSGIYTGALTANQINAVEGISLGQGASINWNYVTKPSYTASDVGALPDDTVVPVIPSYIKSTKITQTTIESPTITGGTITGGTVQTAGTTSKRVVINVNGITSYDGSNKSGFYTMAGTFSEGALGINHLGVSAMSLHWDGSGRGYLKSAGDLYIYNGSSIYTTYFGGSVDFSQAQYINWGSWAPSTIAIFG